MTSRKKANSTPVVKLTKRELKDLREIERTSVKTWGQKTADNYLDAIAASLDQLRDNPKILRLVPDLAAGLFFYRVRKHYLVCDYRGSIVVVLTVIHTSMDLPARILELEPQLLAESQLLQSKLDSAAD